ncbi:hypothetical protein DESUT3_20750 [Desulfuromonas versatilis]|uniref:Methyltransferase domain-containing protein n=1 Tax=Desulfuromonas versatilis TaxID=2802975 RepID=A0ABN6E1I0_9BACT|nr:class I SAM-dependent methyltransferase [Desulfuromonas versatilis]BCR05006.1 hypothetical protein DESUT3_20750 [Desulfuromonas versatilis]
MNPKLLGRKYDRIARWWHENHDNSSYGLAQVERALNFSVKRETALDVGCGAGGRVVRMLQNHGFNITGIDVSQEMIRLAREQHPSMTFLHQDICTWETDRHFDLIVAWDSIFHLPLEMQHPVVAKLCRLLSEGGVLIYSFGDAEGEHEDCWQGDRFHYSSIGINGNLRVLMENGITCRHLELDQWPQKHAFLIGVK